MTPTERCVTEEQIAKFKAALADPMRGIRRIADGMDPLWIKIEEDAMRSQIADLEQQLRGTQ